jgi:hypothetical protein
MKFEEEKPKLRQELRDLIIRGFQMKHHLANFEVKTLLKEIPELKETVKFEWKRQLEITGFNIANWIHDNAKIWVEKTQIPEPNALGDKITAIMKNELAPEDAEQALVELKQKIQQFRVYLYSKAPLFCTHGKLELDCMKTNSPCKRRHQKECSVFQTIKKFEELLKGGETKNE